MPLMARLLGSRGVAALSDERMRGIIVTNQSSAILPSGFGSMVSSKASRYTRCARNMGACGLESAEFTRRLALCAMRMCVSGPSRTANLLDAPGNDRQREENRGTGIKIAESVHGCFPGLGHRAFGEAPATAGHCSLGHNRSRGATSRMGLWNLEEVVSCNKTYGRFLSPI